MESRNIRPKTIWIMNNNGDRVHEIKKEPGTFVNPKIEVMDKNSSLNKSGSSSVLSEEAIFQHEVNIKTEYPESDGDSYDQEMKCNIDEVDKNISAKIYECIIGRTEGGVQQHGIRIIPAGDECKRRSFILQNPDTIISHTKKKTESGQEMEREKKLHNPFVEIRKRMSNRIARAEEISLNSPPRTKSTRVLSSASHSVTHCESSKQTLKRPLICTSATVLNEDSHSKVPKPLDALSKYFESVTETVRSLPPALQIKVKSQISNAVLQAELECLIMQSAVPKKK